MPIHKSTSEKTKHSKHSKHTNQTNRKKTIKKKPMEVEFEARFLEIDRESLIEKIKALGGHQKSPLTVYRRSVFGLCDIKKGYVRVRDEGNTVTLTAKIYKDPKFPEEYELNIKDDFANGQAFLRALNLTEKAYHETMREKWTIPNRGGKNELCEVTFDYIPGLPVYSEVECKTKANLSKSIKMLKLNRDKMRFGGYGNAYAEYYGISLTEINNEIPSITFGNIEEELEKYIHKNKDLLQTTAKSHLEVYKRTKK